MSSKVTLACASALIIIGAVAFAATGSSAAIEPVKIEPAAVIVQHQAVPKEYLAVGSPVPQAGSKIFYEAPDHSVRVGIWESDPGTLKLNMTFDEYIYVIEGESVLRRTDGKSWSFKAGDAFLLPKGFVGEARQVTHFRKQFVDVNPTGSH